MTTSAPFFRIEVTESHSLTVVRGAGTGPSWRSKMLVGYRAKYLGLIFARGFASMLMADQGLDRRDLMSPTPSEIHDVRDAGSPAPTVVARRHVVRSTAPAGSEHAPFGTLGLWQPAGLPRGGIHPTEVCL